jgi:hypothetical protein
MGQNTENLKGDRFLQLSRLLDTTTSTFVLPLFLHQSSMHLLTQYWLHSNLNDHHELC